MTEILMYTKTICPYCDRAKALLKGKGVSWKEINLDHHPEDREKMIRMSDGRRTVPQVFVNGRGLGGSDDIHALDRKGELDRILGLKNGKSTAHERHKVVILGSGPAGLTAAVYAARANLKPLVVAGNEPGGQLTITTEVENYPGYPEGIQGPEMMEHFRKQAERFGTGFKTGNVDKVDLTVRPFLLHLESGEQIAAESLIISTGASAKWLGLPSELHLRNRGVSACATCDGFFFRGKPLAVAGGGDTAMEEALYLTNFATKVTVVHRRDQLRASKVMQDRALKNPKIAFEWNSAIEEVLGDQKTGVTGLRLKNSKTGQEKTLDVAGLFVAIGHQPNTGLFKGLLDMDENGYLKVQPGSTYTNIPGVFAAGDAADHSYRPAVTAAGTGCMAAIDAERWLAAQE